MATLLRIKTALHVSRDRDKPWHHVASVCDGETEALEVWWWGVVAGEKAVRARRGRKIRAAALADDDRIGAVKHKHYLVQGITKGIERRNFVADGGDGGWGGGSWEMSGSCFLGVTLVLYLAAWV